MRRVVCGGCGTFEPQGNGKIVPVTVEVEGDRHVREWEQAERYTEDLCPDCIKSILKTYFGVRVQGVVDPPIVRALP